MPLSTIKFIEFYLVQGITGRSPNATFENLSFVRLLSQYKKFNFRFGIELIRQNFKYLPQLEQVGPLCDHKECN